MTAGISFIMGRSGSGKTEFILSRTVDNEKKGKRSILIVPDRATFETERLLCSRFGGGILNTYVLSFTSLARRVMRESGDSRTFLSAQGRQMLIRRVIDSSTQKLSAFARVANRMGFSSECDGIILKCKRFSISPEELLGVCPTVGTQLAEKLHDFALIFDGVNDAMAERYIDAEDLVNSLVELLPSSSLCEADVFIDAPESLSEQSIRIISVLMDIAQRITVSLRGDTSETCRDRRIFDNDNLNYRRLRRLADEKKTEVEFIALGEDMRKKPPCLKHLEKNLFAFPSDIFKGDCSSVIELHLAGSRTAEVLAAAEAIRNAAKDGLRYRDMAVIVGDSGGYANTIKRIFREFGIPFFMDVKRPIYTHPVSELLINALKCVEGGFRAKDFLGILKTGLVKVSHGECELIENYVLRYGLNGLSITEPFTLDGASCEAEEARKRAVEPLVNLKSRLSGHSNASMKLRALFAYIEEIGLAETLKTDCEAMAEAGDYDAARENAQIYDTVIELLDQIHVILGESNIGLAKFISIVEEGLLSYSVGIIPTTLDQVIIGDVDSSCLPEIRFMQILGMNEGLIPKTKPDNAIINDTELRLLNSLGINTWQSTENMNRNESLRIYSLITKAVSKLRISYTCEIGGNTAVQSHLFDRIRRMFPSCKFTNGILSPVSGSTERAAFSRLSKELRSMADTSEEAAETGTLYAMFAENTIYSSALSAIDQNLIGTDINSPLGQNDTLRLYGETATGTATRLETFNRCPFRYFMQFGLSVKERKEYEEKATDRGAFIHEVLDRLMKGLIADKVDWNDVSEEEVSARLTDIFVPLMQEHNNGIYLSSARMRAELLRLMEMLCIASFALVRQVAVGSFRPLGSEVSFGRKGDILPALDIRTPDGSHFRVCGIVDRLDGYSTGNTDFIRIIDYKSGSLKFDYTELANGLKLQLPLYAAAMEAALRAEANIAKNPGTAGFYYLHVNTPEAYADTPEELKAEIQKSFKMHGLTLDEDIVTSAVDSIGTGFSDTVSGLRHLKDGSCSGMLASSDEMRHTLDFARATAVKTLEAVMLGRIEISPSSCKGITACKYCPYGSICGFDPAAGSRYRRIRAVTADSFFNRKK